MIIWLAPGNSAKLLTSSSCACPSASWTGSCPNCRSKTAPRAAGVDFNLFRPLETLVFTAWVGNAAGQVPENSRIGSDSVGGVWASMTISWIRETLQAPLVGGLVGGGQGQNLKARKRDGCSSRRAPSWVTI